MSENAKIMLHKKLKAFKLKKFFKIFYGIIKNYLPFILRPS